MIMLMKIVLSNKTATSKSSEYKTKIIEGAPINNNALNIKIVVPLNYLNNF